MSKKDDWSLELTLFGVSIWRNFLNILQNVAMYLFKYFLEHIAAIPRNDTFLYHRTNQISLSLVSIMG